MCRYDAHAWSTAQQRHELTMHQQRRHLVLRCCCCCCCVFAAAPWPAHPFCPRRQPHLLCGCQYSWPAVHVMKKLPRLDTAT
jgi:hypothetical protein